MDALFKDMNQLILEAEKYNEPERLRDLLSPSLVFIRASGERVDKETYLQQMTGTCYSILKQHSLKIIPMTTGSVCVLLEIEAKGIKPTGGEFGGWFRNARFFRQEKNEWKLYAWRNDPLKQGEGNTRSAPVLEMKDKFSGLVAASKFYEQELPGGGKWQDVFFHPGSRTHWHIHPEGQDLFVHAGTALVVKRNDNDKTELSRLTPGEKIHIPPGVFHWHGATPGSFMSHIAYNGFTHAGETTFWFSPVTDKEFNAAAKKG